MRIALTALTLASAVCILSVQSAGAVAVDAAALKQPVSTASPVQQVQFYYGHARAHPVKCYRELLIGPYVCHHVGRGWWLF
jgi:hypothetical protein